MLRRSVSKEVRDCGSCGAGPAEWGSGQPFHDRGTDISANPAIERGVTTLQTTAITECRSKRRRYRLPTRGWAARGEPPLCYDRSS